MMSAAEGMTQMIPNHILRVGQTVRLGSAQETVHQHPSGNHDDPELDISLDNLNRLILELDPTFEPIEVNKGPSSHAAGTARLRGRFAPRPLFCFVRLKQRATNRGNQQRCDTP